LRVKVAAAEAMPQFRGQPDHPRTWRVPAC